MLAPKAPAPITTASASWIMTRSHDHGDLKDGAETLHVPEVGGQVVHVRLERHVEERLGHTRVGQALRVLTNLVPAANSHRAVWILDRLIGARHQTAHDELQRID